MESEKRDRIILTVIVVTTLATFASIAIPNLRTSWNRERQKRSMADMRSLATAMEARATETNDYAIGSGPLSDDATEFASLKTVSLNDVERALVPKYIKKLPRHDAWGEDFEVRIAKRSYAIRSKGSDRRAEANIKFNHVIKNFDQDLVFSLGNFIQYPEGTCTQ